MDCFNKKDHFPIDGEIDNYDYAPLASPIPYTITEPTILHPIDGETLSGIVTVT